MAASRVRVMGASSAPFYFSAFLLALMPTSIGYQDLAALFAQQTGLSQNWREHMIASPFGTVEPAIFTYGRPVGTSIPEPLGFQLASFDPDTDDTNDWRIDAPVAPSAPALTPTPLPPPMLHLKSAAAADVLDNVPPRAEPAQLPPAAP